MKQTLRAGVIFMVALFIANLISTAVLNIAKGQFIAHIDHGAWWPQGYATLEIFEFALYVVLFAVLGTLFARCFKRRVAAVAVALLLGATFSAVSFALEPNSPFVRYSHAPTWLWVLSWSQFYVPPIASALGAAVYGTVLRNSLSTDHAA